MAHLLKRLAVAAAIFVICFSAILIATFFFFAAIYFWFEEILRPPLAALATAGALVGFALLVMLLGILLQIRLGRRKPRPDRSWLLGLLEAPEGLSAVAIGNLLGRRLYSFARKNTQSAVIASLVAGLVLGISPGLRSLLRNVLKE